MATHILHDTDCLFSLRDKLVLLGLDLGPSILSQMVIAKLITRGANEPRSGLLALGGVEAQARILDAAPGARGELDAGVEGGGPAGQELGLDGRVLGQPRLAHLLLRDRVLLQPRRQRVFRAGLFDAAERRRRRQRRARDGVVEGLGLWFCGRRRGHGCCGFRGGGCAAEEADLFGDGAAKVIERFANVARVVVGLMRVLGAVSGGRRLANEFSKAMKV